MTLVETMVTISLGLLVLSVVSVLYVFGLRSFGAMNNYADMDAKSRQSLDLMTREIRQATQVTDYQTNGSTVWLSLTDALRGINIKYTWFTNSGLLICVQTGETPRTNLIGCDRWSFAFYTRVPDTNGNFYPTTDPSLCKLINMYWKCSRTNIVLKINTEIIVIAEVVLRNKQ